MALEEIAENKLAQERFLAEIATLFSSLALYLACVGLYGSLLYAVAQRTNEIGIRMALGAQAANVVALIAREMAGIVAAGINWSMGRARVDANDCKSLVRPHAGKSADDRGRGHASDCGCSDCGRRSGPPRGEGGSADRTTPRLTPPHKPKTTIFALPADTGNT